MLQPDSETVSTIYSALESVHASLAIMAYNGMPKQLYKEEVHSSSSLLITFYTKNFKTFTDRHSCWTLIFLYFVISFIIHISFCLH